MFFKKKKDPGPQKTFYSMIMICDKEFDDEERYDEICDIVREASEESMGFYGRIEKNSYMEDEWDRIIDILSPSSYPLYVIIPIDDELLWTVEKEINKKNFWGFGKDEKIIRAQEKVLSDVSRSVFASPHLEEVVEFLKSLDKTLT